MGHLFYTELGNIGHYDVNGNIPQVWGFVNKGPFTNLQTGAGYWSDTGYALDANHAWTFYFYYGYQTIDPYNYQPNPRALAVHSGNVGAPVPLPPSMLLFGTGLVGLIGYMRLKTRRGV